ncbi:MAG: hypothetical protein IKU36_01060 [Bacteroidales bacterium]|nr:hypothetical protein [Bacteroidales bacterium]
MTELERYISSNLEAFDCESIPEGGKERFMNAVRQERRNSRIQVISMAFTGIAACIAIMMAVFVEPDISKELERHYKRMAMKENEILTIVERECPEETDMIMNTLRTITADAIPLEEQLPDELSTKEKSMILNEYYNNKYSALENLMTNIYR